MDAASDEGPFDAALIQQVVNSHSDGGRLKFRPDADRMLAYLAGLFVKEGALRAASIAKDENRSVVDEQHMAKILPKLLLDF